MNYCRENDIDDAFRFFSNAQRLHEASYYSSKAVLRDKERQKRYEEWRTLYEEWDLSKDLYNPVQECQIVVKVREFNNVLIHRPHSISTRFIDYNISNDYFKWFFLVKVYPNGHDCSTEGSISVKFSLCEFLRKKYYLAKDVELTCVIAVVDAEECRRFFQSFVILRSTVGNDGDFAIDNYISRTVLLNEPSELLPDNVLTLHMDVILKQNISNYDVDASCLGTQYQENGPEGPGHYLSVDCRFAKQLAEESSDFNFFLSLDTPDKAIKLIGLEGLNFQVMEKILNRSLNVDTVFIFCLNNIFSLYKTAEKYNFKSIIDTCRSWFKLCISPSNVQDIKEFAERFEDDDMREMVELFESEDRGNEGVKADFMSVSISLTGEWTCEAKRSSDFTHFHFSRKKN